MATGDDQPNELGYELARVSTGNEGLDDILGGGLDAVKLRPGLRVLFITGYAETVATGRGQLGQDMEVISKPFALHTLATKISSMIARPQSAAV